MNIDSEFNKFVSKMKKERPSSAHSVNAMAREAILYGYTLGQEPPNQEVTDVCTCTEPRTFFGNGINIICVQCQKPITVQR